MKKQKILLVDDSQKFHDLFMQIISLIGDEINVEVEHVLDSSKALEVALNYMPDVIFTDFLMPEPNGYELCKIFKAHSSFKLVPFILLTISAGDKNLLLGIEAGIDDFIVKSSGTELFQMKIKGIMKLTRFKSEALEQIEEARLKVAESSRMANLGALTAALSHQINNPLTIISGKIQKLIKWSQDSSKPISVIQADLDAMLVKSERISELIGYLRLCAGTANPDPMEKASISFMINEALAHSSENIKKSGANITIDQPEELFIKCHPFEISDVISRLLDNSCDAVTKLQTKWIKIAIEKTERNFARIMVTDSGPGIPPEVVPKLMQPFFTTKDVNTGLGLNLSISNGVIQYHKGSLNLDRTFPNTRFVIELPLISNAKEI